MTQLGARAVLANFGGRICDLPGWYLDALAGAMEEFRTVRRRYDRSRRPRRARSTTS